MRKSVKILFATLITALVLMLASCDILASAMIEIGNLENKTFTTTVDGHTVKLIFGEQNSNGNYSLSVKVDNNIITNHEFEWTVNANTTEAGPLDLWIYMDRLEGNYDYIIGTLRPDSLSPSRLTVVENPITFGSVTVPVNKAFSN